MCSSSSDPLPRRAAPLRPEASAGDLVLVEAAPALASQVPGGDHALEQRRRRVVADRVLLVEGVAHEQRRVETDVVEQLEWPHRVPAAELHSLVDVLLGGEPGLVEADRVVEEGDEQQVDDESAAVLRDDDPLAELLAESARLLQRLVAGG